MKQKSSKNIAIIGAGFSGLSAANYLAKEGYNVNVFEKHDKPGGRARQYIEDGFKFDMGPTWYWMPDVFQNFFGDFGKSPGDYYKLKRLDPGYRVYFGKNDKIDISSDLDKIFSVFEDVESGSSIFLKRFLKDAEYNYRAAMQKVVFMPGKTPFELITPQTVKRVGQFFTSIKSKVRSGIKNERLSQILEFPVLFLGAKPKDTPAFYCFMNYADMVMGTWYPEGGMYSVVKGFEKLAIDQGVKINYNQQIKKIEVDKGMAVGIKTEDNMYYADAIVSGADYHHTESLLEEKYRNYKEKYWKKKVFAPSALLFYVGFNKKLENLEHHTLFFDSPFDKHAKSIYDSKNWPEEPLFYASFPSLTDPQCSPKDCESAIFLIPIATGIEDTEDIRNRYFNEILERLENLTQQSVKESVIVLRSYCLNDFINDYNAYGGNAYGLSNILKQTAFLKPKLQNKKLQNMFYTGQLTVPGPGVPPTIISGKIVANLTSRYLDQYVL